MQRHGSGVRGAGRGDRPPSTGELLLSCSDCSQGPVSPSRRRGRRATSQPSLGSLLGSASRRHGRSARRNRNGSGSGVREESTPSSPPRRQVLSAVRLVLLPPLFLHRGSRAEGPLGSPDRGRDPWTPTPPLWVPQRLGPRASSQGAPGAPRGTDSGQRTGPTWHRKMRQHLRQTFSEALQPEPVLAPPPFPVPMGLTCTGGGRTPPLPLHSSAWLAGPCWQIQPRGASPSRCSLPHPSSSSASPPSPPGSCVSPSRLPSAVLLRVSGFRCVRPTRLSAESTPQRYRKSECPRAGRGLRLQRAVGDLASCSRSQ